MLLVTGITGHTGKYFLQELVNHKYKEPIRCIIRQTSDTTMLDNCGLNIEKVIGDLDNPSFIEEAMDGVETVMHIYNIHHSPSIVRSAMKKKVKRAILVHTTGIYSEFKYASEEYKNIEQQINEMEDSKCDVDITILRPSMIYGDLCDSNMSKFIKMIDKFKVMPVIDGGRSLIQPVNARDLGKAFYKVLMSPEKTKGNSYDLTGERPIKMVDAFKTINKELNKRTFYVSFPLGIGVLLAKLSKSFSMGKVDYVERVQRMGENRSYSHSKATKDFGYTPMSFEKGIKIEVQQYLKKH
ncbi:NAD-dependent epimerase/dehydratase family protein [Halobacillus fulvus]|nr:NAD-dependent epimerase/dehydratase family protein [Halobacillus fulvus]